MQKVGEIVSNLFKMNAKKAQEPAPPHDEKALQNYYDFESSIRTDRIDRALHLITVLNEEETSTGLWYAAFYGRDKLIPPLITRLKDFGTIEEFLEKNIMVNQSISVAAEKGMLGAIKLLMGIGASLETPNSDKMTPLHCAAAHNHAEVVGFCLEEGVDRNARDRHGNSAFHYAAKQLTCATARVLYKFIDQNFTRCMEQELNVENNAGYTPLDEAFKNCCLKVAEYLWKNGAKVNHVKKIMDRDRTGRTSLHLSVYDGNLELVKFLCKSKVPLNFKDANGNTALHTAARFNHEDIVGVLVGADVDLEIRNEQGNTALTIARQCQHHTCADIIARATNRKLVSVYGVCDSEDITIGVGGAPGAGKTTFIDSFQRSYFWSIFTNESRADKGATELSSRTRGIRVERTRDPLGSPNVYHFLDFGGHQEYIPSHSLFISESTTPAMAVCLVDAQKTFETLSDEMELWCGVFISCHRLKESKPEKDENEEPEAEEGEFDYLGCRYDSDEDCPPPKKKADESEDEEKSEDPDEDKTATDSDPEPKPAATADETTNTEDEDAKDGEEEKTEEEKAEEEEAEAAKKKKKEEDDAPLKMPFLLVVSRLDSERIHEQTEVVLRAYGRIVRKFRHRLAFEAEPIFLDARKSQANGLKEARGHIQRLSLHLLKHTDKTPRLIHAVRKVLPDVRRKIGRPFTDRETFKETLLTVLENKKAGLHIRTGVEMLIDAVLQLLSCCGEVVVFSTTEDLRHVVVLRAEWLLTTIVGHLCSPKNFPRVLISFEDHDSARADKKKSGEGAFVLRRAW
eukprot:scpid12938/ scgid32479/ Death-associated protein kinase 1